MISECLNIFTATAKGCIGDTLLYSTIEIIPDVDFNFVENNNESLAKVYNAALDQALKEDRDHLILVHDDVQIEFNPYEKLWQLLNTEYDLLGVAGTTRMEMKSPALWHLMGGGFEGGNLRGAVSHAMEIDANPPWVTKKFMTSFGPYPERVVAIDGVFMAFGKKAIRSLRFDEDCPSKFHFYDLCLCQRALHQGLKIGVGDIMITHASPGLREYTEDWKAGEKYYLETYGN